MTPQRCLVLLVLGALLSGALESFAANSAGLHRTLYVDAEHGDDGAAGSSPAAAWKTVARVNRATLHPGDAVLFKAGGLWREELIPPADGAPDAPIRFAAYGEGPQPVISGADLVAPSAWQPWRANARYGCAIYAADYAPPGGRIYNLYVNGGDGAQARNYLGSDPKWGLLSAGCLPGEGCQPAKSTYLGAMRPGSWFFDGGAHHLYVWLADGSSPAAQRVEIAIRHTAIGGEKRRSNLVFENLKLERAGNGIYFYADTLPGVKNLLFRHLTITQTGTGQLDDGQYLSAIKIIRGSRVVYDGNRISYAGNHGNGINNQSVDDATAINNDVSHFNHNGIDSKCSDRFVVRNNIIHDARLAPRAEGLGPGVTNFLGFNGVYAESEDGRRGDGTHDSYPAREMVVEGNQIYNLEGNNGTGVGIQFDVYVSDGNRVCDNDIHDVQIGLGLFSGGGRLCRNRIVNAAMREIQFADKDPNHPSHWTKVSADSESDSD